MRATLIMLALSLTLAAEVREGKLPRPGFDLHYRVYRPGAPVLLLSGGPGFDPEYLAPVAAALPGSILVDLRGTGRSIPPKLDHDTINLKRTWPIWKRFARAWVTSTGRFWAIPREPCWP